MSTPRKKNKLTIPAVETYLQSKGWTKTEGANHNVIIYRGSRDVEGKPLVVALPARSDLIDADQRLAAVVKTVATIEAKSPLQLEQVIVSQAPVIQIRRNSKVQIGATQTTTKNVSRQVGLRTKSTVKNSL